MDDNDKTSTAILADLCERMNMLRLRHGIVFRDLSPAALPFPPLAGALARGLVAKDKDAVIVARSLVDPAEMDTPAFWATPLGRLMFRAGAFPGETISQTFAARVLGCSRQWVGEMVSKGVLAHDDGKVYVAQIAAKIDKMGK